MTRLMGSTILLLFCFTAVAGSTQEAEIRTVLNLYNQAFAQGDTDAISESVYAVPSHMFFGSEGYSLNSKDEIKNDFEQLFQSLKGDDYHHSDLETQSLCFLNPSTALLSIAYARKRSDGSVIETGEATYLFRKFAAGWRIVVATDHASDKSPRC